MHGRFNKYNMQVLFKVQRNSYRHSQRLKNRAFPVLIKLTEA